MATKRYLSSNEADTMLAAARAVLEEIGVPSTIVIVDAGGALLRLFRMDDASLISLDVGIAKARFANAIRMSTADVGTMAEATPAVLALPNVIPFPGGVPIMIDGECVGGLGVSGGLPEDDQKAAMAAVSAIA